MAYVVIACAANASKLWPNTVMVYIVMACAANASKLWPSALFGKCRSPSSPYTIHAAFSPASVSVSWSTLFATASANLCSVIGHNEHRSPSCAEN